MHEKTQLHNHLKRLAPRHCFDEEQHHTEAWLCSAASITMSVTTYGMKINSKHTQVPEAVSWLCHLSEELLQ